MAAQNTIFKSLGSILSFGGATARKSKRAAAPNLIEIDEEQQFLASIAHLTPEERQKRLQMREMYRRMAQRQGIMEVEHQSDPYYKR
jgi:deoxyribodipyrimidine photolyase-like uncharacterized protein